MTRMTLCTLSSLLSPPPIPVTVEVDGGSGSSGGGSGESEGAGTGAIGSVFVRSPYTELPNIDTNE